MVGFLKAKGETVSEVYKDRYLKFKNNEISEVTE